MNRKKSDESLVSCVRSLVAAQIEGASEEARALQAERAMNCDRTRAGELVDLAVGAAQVAIRADEGENPLDVWRQMGGPALGEEQILHIVQAAREAIEQAEGVTASAARAGEGERDRLLPHVAEALEATYSLYLKAVPLFEAGRDLGEVAAMMPSGASRRQEALELAGQFQLVYRLSKKATRQGLTPVDMDMILKESDGTFLLFRRVMVAR